MFQSSDRQSAWRTMDRGSDIVQEAVFKTIPKKKECKKAKSLSEEALQIPDKRKEAKSKDIPIWMQSSKE